MPQLALLALAGAGLYAGAKWLMTVHGTATAPARDTMRSRRTSGMTRDPAKSSAKNMGLLEWDPIAGVYRPRSR